MATIGQARALLSWAQGASLAADIAAVTSGFSNLADDEQLAGDALTLVAALFPSLTLAVDIAEVLLALVELGAIKPDPLPMTDAQTTESPHSGRRG